MPIGFLEPRNIDLRQSNHNEWLCLEILKAYGIDVAKAQLASFEDQNVLVTERFDRRWSMDGRWLMRLPQEDFCQALGVSPALKYENHGGPGIKEGMDLLRGSQQAIHDRETFFKLQILFWMLAAIDGHAKNFSLFIEPGSAYRMTPVYDVLSAYPLMAANSAGRQSQNGHGGKRKKPALPLAAYRTAPFHQYRQSGWLFGTESTASIDGVGGEDGRGYQQS